MPGLYDTILHRRFSGTLSGRLFAAALSLRNTWFALHEAAGAILSGPKKIPPLDTERINRILLIRTDRIGDIVLTSPALRALRRRFPHARIDMVVQEKYASLLNCYPGWTTVIPVADVLDSKEISDCGNLLLAAAYDAVLVFHPAAYAYRLARLSNAAWRIGWRAKGFGYLLTHALADDRMAANRHQVENNLMLLEPLGIRESAPVFNVSATPAGETEARSFVGNHPELSGKKMCVVHPGSYSPRVRWPPQRYAALVDRLNAAGAAPLILGGPADKAAVDRVREISTSKPAVATGFSLEGMVSLLARASLFVGNSSGPLHIAASAGIPTIGIFGPRYGLDRHELWAPFGKNGRVVSARPDLCRKCLPWTCPDLRCMQEVTMDMVWDAVRNSGIGLH